MKYDFVAIGDVTMDTFIELSQAHVEKHAGETDICMRFGDKIPFESAVVIPGVGNAGNAAVSAARLGITSALVTDVGTDAWGTECIEAWKKDSVATEYARRHEQFPTHHHYVLRFKAERTILIKHQPWPYALPAFEESPAWIYFTSTGEHGEPYHHEIAEYVKAHPETKLGFQPGTFQINLSADGVLEDLYAVSEIVFCNKEEAQRILKTESDDIVGLLKGMRALGPNIAVITDGPKGAYAMDANDAWYMPIYPDPAPPVDRTGAGDAFASTMVALIAAGMSVADALTRAPINSMSVVQEIGAQKGLLSREKLEEWLAKAPASYKAEKIA